MIASFGLGDVDQIAAEEEFLYSLNRFNVIASRAKAKLIVIMSRRLVDHLPRDRQALEESRLLKHYATGFYGSRAPWSSLVSMNPVIEVSMMDLLPATSLLDTGDLPVGDIAMLAKREGARPRPAYQAHKWFARRFAVNARS